MDAQWTGNVTQHLDDYLAMERQVSAPYRAFVFDDAVQAEAVSRCLFDSGACEYGPPFAHLLLNDGKISGMMALLTGREVKDVRLRGAIVLGRSGILRSVAHVQQRIKLAAQTLMKLAPDDYYISRFAVLPYQRGQHASSALLERAQSEGVGKGCRRLTAEIHVGNMVARNCCRRFRFEDVQTSRAHDPVSGRVLEYVHVIKQLA